MISTGQTLVGTTATKIDGTSTNAIRMTIQNLDSTDKLYIGGPGVTVSAGLALLKEAMIQLDLSPLQEIYAVSSKTGHSISWMRQD